MTGICIAYAFGCTGFCLGFVACAILTGTAPGSRRARPVTADDAAAVPQGADPR